MCERTEGREGRENGGEKDKENWRGRGWKRGLIISCNANRRKPQNNENRKRGVEEREKKERRDRAAVAAATTAAAAAVEETGDCMFIFKGLMGERVSLSRK